MTAEDLIAQFVELVDDPTTADEQVLIWLNAAYDAINTKRNWNYAKKTDTSKSVIAGTAGYALPADFLYTTGKAYLYQASTGNYSPLHLVPFESRFEFSNDPYAVYVDFAAQELRFVRTPNTNTNFAGLTIILPYIYQPPQLELDDEPVFVRGAHMILAFEAARMFWYNDQSEKDRAWNREMQTEYNRLEEIMANWDARIDAGASQSWQPLNAFPGLDGQGSLL